MPKKNNTLRQKLKYWFICSVLIFIGSTSMIVMILGFTPINTSAFMIERHLADFYSDRGFIPINQQWIKRENISPYIFSAVVASEDQLFFQHHGFDINSIYSAIKYHLSGGKLRGASTISQQVAKNLFLSSSRSLWRKGFEAWFTILIELFWNKERILLVYVNIAEFGNHLYGVEAASKYYFSIPASRLNPNQAALLAASLPNPARLKINNPNKKLIKKQQWILQQMKNINFNIYP